MDNKYKILPNLDNAMKRTKLASEIIREKITISDELKNIAKNKTYTVRTFGCQANVRDGEIIAGILEEIGYKKANDLEHSDVIILNTCAIRENANERVFGEIGHLRVLKRHNPDLVFALCGCMAQQENVVNQILNTNNQVDLVFGTHNIASLPDLLLQAYLSHEKVVQVYSKEGEVYEDLPSTRDDKYKAWVNIMYGCDKFCTYCVVPYTRGKERSRLKEDIIAEVKCLKENGYKEITLLGQNVNAYGKDLKLGYDFETLLKEVADTGIERIRFTTSHPWNFTKGMIEAIRDYPNIMPYVHLPLQSGDDEILRRMSRRYNSKEYLELYHMIRNTIPNVAISTDIIVGFPNESDEAFEHTMDVVREAKFDSAYTFIYSPRPHTPAASMDDPISMETKKKRLTKLIELVKIHSKERNIAYEGKILKVLVEGPSKRNPNILSGYSEENKLVNFKGDISNVGKIVKVKILKAKNFTLDGEQVDE